MADAAATRELVDVGQEQLRHASQPVLIPMAAAMQITANDPPAPPTQSYIVVSIENVGLGPALGIKFGVVVLTPDGTRVERAQIDRGELVALGARQGGRHLILLLPTLDVDNSTCRFVVAYGDIFGRRYTMSGEFAADAVLRNVVITEVDESGTTISSVSAAPRL